MAFDATSGGASANSFCTVAEADAYLEDRYDTTSWEAYDSTERALIIAAGVLDRLEWLGAPETTTQALQWPRTGVVDRFGAAITTVPSDLKGAQATLAYMIVTDDWSDVDVAFKHLNIDGIVVDDSGRRGLPSKVQRLIAHLYVDRSYTAKVMRV